METQNVRETTPVILLQISMETLLREEFGKFEFPSRVKSHCFTLDPFALTWAKTIKNTIPIVVEFNPLFLIRFSMAAITRNGSLITNKKERK